MLATATVSRETVDKLFPHLKGFPGPFPVSFTDLEALGFPGILDLMVELSLPALHRDGNASALEYRLLAGVCRYQADAAKQRNQPCHVLEIGTFNGLSTLQIAKNIGSDGRIVTLTVKSASEVSLQTDGSFNDKYADATDVGCFYLADASIRERVTQVWGDSARVTKAELNPPASGFDLAFIDGCHSYDYVKNDTELVRGLLRPGGIIVWHDYGKPDWPGVQQYLQELARAGELIFWLSGRPHQDGRHPDRTSLALAIC